MALKIFRGLHRQTVRPNTTLPFSFALMLIGAAGLIPITANGQVNSWNNPQSGTWNWATAANWSLGLAPASSQSIFITNSAGGMSGTRFRTVTVDSSTAGQPATMTVDSVTVSGVGSGMGASHNTLFLNNAGTTTPLHVLGDCTISDNSIVNIGNSTLLIDGGGTTGLSADGTVTLNAGGNLIVTGGEAIGAQSQGTLTIAGGSNMLDNLNIGLNPGSAGSVLVTDGSLVSTGLAFGICVGRGGVGSLMQSGGTLSAFTEIVGLSSAGTLSIAGGTHFLQFELSIGVAPSTTGTVWITGGLLVVNVDVQLGLSSAGSLIQSNGVAQIYSEIVGSQGQGTLTIADGTHIVGSQGLRLGFFGGTGTVWLTGGQLVVTNNDLGTISGSFLGLSSPGRMTVSNGSWLASSVFVGANDGGEGTLTVAGGVSTISSLVVGDCPSNVAGVVWLKGGDVFVTNATHDAVLDVRNGFFLLTAGQLVVDKLVMTNDCGTFIHAGGDLTVGSMLLDPNLDADGDGLPNGWEQAHGLDPLSSIGNDGADGDPDGDGLSNLEEYQLGTDPLDRTSPYHITAIQRQGDDVLVTWMTVNGKTNVIQYTHGTANGSYSNNFVDLSPQIIAPGCFCVASTNYLDVGGATNAPARYYRVRVAP